MSIKQNSEIASKLEKLIQDKNTNVNALSKKSGVPQPTIFKIVKGLSKDPKRSTMEKIAEALNVNIDFFYGPIEETTVPFSTNGRKTALLPLLSWVQAGSFTNIQTFSSDDYEWYMCPVNISKRSYCLRVRGISMEPKFSEGDIVFVDADRVAGDGDIVIAQDTDFDETAATMKKLVIDGSHKYLQPLNPDWPEKFIPCTENTRIVGVVIGKYVPV